MLKQLQKLRPNTAGNISAVRHQGFTVSATQQWYPRAAAWQHPGSARPRVRSGGFTIIEVLIVLAIAALIMIVVFLAVPAVQRSQRNQSRKADTKNLFAAISDFASSNGAAPPSTQANIDTATSNMRFGYYKTANVFYGGTPTATVSASNTTPAKDTNTVEEVNVYTGMICTTSTGVPTATGATSRNVALLYVLEQATGSGLLQCLSS